MFIIIVIVPCVVVIFLRFLQFFFHKFVELRTPRQGIRSSFVLVRFCWGNVSFFLYFYLLRIDFPRFILSMFHVFSFFLFVCVL